MATAQEEPRMIGDLITPDGTASLFEALRDYPAAGVGCLYHPNMMADVVYATPDGAACRLESRISPFCGMHIVKETQDPMIALLDMTGGYWSKREQFIPLLQRDHLEDYKSVLAKIFEVEEPEQPTAPVKRRWSGILRNFAQLFPGSDI